MGGGASSVQMLDDVLATTYMIGKAIAAISFPGMYRIYDFHSPKAPRLNVSNNFSFFSPDSDDEEEDAYEAPPLSQYGHFFKIVVGSDQIYIEDPCAINEAGWTPLHSCCMSFLTKDAGALLLEEMLQRGGNIDAKTLIGPGTFNKGWTPLHIACAYGVEPLVDKLIACGANVSTVNSFGYSPLLEACHRGFINIVSSLLKGGATVNYSPPDDQASASPFIGAPPQTALGEASRSGFQRIVQMLLEAGANKNYQNHLGWTALHEACFYNRIETVKTLLLSGANPCLRTTMGALPYHLSGLQVLKTMIGDIGGPEAVPDSSDQIDMLAVLKELTMVDTEITSYSNGNVEFVTLDSKSMSGYQMLDDDNSITTTTSMTTIQDAGAKAKAPNKSPSHKRSSGSQRDFESIDDKEPSFLHNGEMLGQLPSLTATRPSPGKISTHEIDAVLNNQIPSPSKRADDKKPKKKKKGKGQDVPADIPPHFLCQLSKRPMTEPVKSSFGHVFEKSAITNWFSQQGRLCPLTGAPLSEVNLKPMDGLAEEIREWILNRGMQKAPTSDDTIEKTIIVVEESKQDKLVRGSAVSGGQSDDLYDF